MVEEALDLAERLAAAAEAGRVDLGDLGQHARRLLESSTGTPPSWELPAQAAKTLLCLLLGVLREIFDCMPSGWQQCPSS